MSKKINRIGKVYGRLFVLKEQPYKNKWGDTISLCKCLGPHEPKYINVPSYKIGKYTFSCGCRNIESVSKKNLKHGHNRSHKKRTPTYNSWRSMMDRCYGYNSVNYKNYGGRGIFVCRRWRLCFANFLQDMGDRPNGKTLDRIDVGSSYGPWNCRWSNNKTQVRNRRSSRLTFEKVLDIKKLLKEEKLYLKEIAGKFGVHVCTISDIKQNRLWGDVPWE